MSKDDFVTEDGFEEIEENGTEEVQEQELPDGEVAGTGRFGKLLGDDSRRFKLSGMFKEWYLDYASYTILYRAVPHIVDGLKPVQRRVLHAMYKIDDGAYTKVANIIGQAMQYHPHGDSSIGGALVQLGQKGLLIDCQGNWGNIITGDSNAAPRYIEARLSKFAKEVVFNPKTTPWMTSYDGRNQEPVELPVKFPLLLAQGTEGIAAGLASKILPHNFNELLDASIAILQDKPFELLPDFPTGGYADCSRYNNGRRGGVVKVRAKLEKIDKNTIAITEVPYGKTTQLLMESIMKAKDKGKIKIKKIEDLTTEKAEIIIHLPNDVSPDKTIDALYAFTDCEVSISPNTCVIVDKKPQFLGVDEVLRYDTLHTRDLLRQELEIRLGELESDWHYFSLEKIFFEEKVYKLLETDSANWEAQLDGIFARMKEFQHLLKREILMEDILKLIEKPVRKISKFDTKVIDEKILSIEDEMAKVNDNLAHLTAYTISWFSSLKKKYGKQWQRLTEITGFENIAANKVVNNNLKLYVNKVEGFVGTALKKDENTEYICDCSDMSEFVTILKDGKYMVRKVGEKVYVGSNIEYVGLFTRGDSRTIYNVIYRDGKGPVSYAKRFALTSITRDKEYDITQGTPGSVIQWLTVNANGEAETVKVFLKAKLKLKKLIDEYDFSQLDIKGRASRGNVVARKNAVQRIALKSKGQSTIGGKDIWFDADIQKLNDEERGLYLGQFNNGDHILAIFTDGTYYTTSFDLSSRYQGELLRIEKFDSGKTYTALYYDKAAKSFYVKRFSFEVSDNSPVCFISAA
ncbi:MAG: DNA gyrase/topoisomerase IV subunit A, partial [Candidatus Cryptobacteroides sp.]